MSKRIKTLIQSDLSERLGGVESVAVINPRGIDANKNNALRGRLRAKGLRMTVVRNTLVRRAVADTPLSGFERLLEGPSAVIYAESSQTSTLSISAVARLLLDEKKTDDTLEFRGIYTDGELYEGFPGVEQVSQLPTREEAIGTLVTCMLSPGRKLAGVLKAPASNLAGILKTIEQKHGEEGSDPAAATAA